jgi:hypothetical protein
MALEGTIKDFGLADILQLIGIQRKTGVLTVENDDDSVTVRFIEGQVVGADTRRRNLEDLLGSVLVRTGRITEAQLRETLKLQKTTLQRLGYILVKSGLVNEKDLVEALRVQVTQIVYRLFRWRSGRYHFAPSDHVEYDREHFVPVSAETILMEGARMVDEWPIIERRIRSGSMVVRKTAAGAAIEAPVRSIVEADIDLVGTPGEGEEGDIVLSADALEVLRLVDGSSTVQEIAERCALGEFDAYRILYELLNRNLLEEVRATVALEPLTAPGARVRLAARSLALLIAALALLAVATLRFNPLSPWTIEGRSATSDRLRTFASRARIDRIDEAVRAFYLDFGAVPDSVEILARTGYLTPRDLVDPWGRAYGFERTREGYRIAGVDETGAPRPDLERRRRFSPSQRLVLEGAPAGRRP